jgi:hypothetical protein
MGQSIGKSSPFAIKLVYSRVDWNTSDQAPLRYHHLSRDSPQSLLLATPHSPECQESRVRTFTTMFPQPPFIILLALPASPITLNAAETPGKRSSTAPSQPIPLEKSKDKEMTPPMLFRPSSGSFAYPPSSLFAPVSVSSCNRARSVYSAHMKG